MDNQIDEQEAASSQQPAARTTKATKKNKAEQKAKKATNESKAIEPKEEKETASEIKIAEPAPITNDISNCNKLPTTDPILKLRTSTNNQPKSNKWLLWAIPLIILVAFAAFEYTQLTKQDNNIINIQGYQFVKLSNGDYRTEITTAGTKKIPVDFRLNPKEAKDIALDSNVTQKLFNSKSLYIAINPAASERGKLAVAAAEISRLTAMYGIETKGAYTQNTSNSAGIPIKTCDDVSYDTAIIAFNTSEKSNIYLSKNGCIIVSAENADKLMLAADRLGMAIIGINV